MAKTDLASEPNMANSDLLSASGFFPTFLNWVSDHYADIILAIIAWAVVVLILLAVKAVIVRAAQKLRQDRDWRTIVTEVARKTRLWFLVALSARMVQGYAQPPVEVAQTISFIFVITAVLQVAIWARAFLIALVEYRAAASGADDRNLGSALGIIKLLVSVAVFSIAAILILDNLGVNVTGLVAGLGIGGIAIGLAAQGVFSDLFAALSIIFDKPFKIGDAITYSGKEGPVTGTVEKIGLKSTRIRSLTGELRIIGNTQLLAQEVTNYVGRSVFRMHLPVGIIYQTPPDVAETVPQIMQEETEKSGNRFVRANFTGFGASSIDFELYFEADVDNVVAANAAYQAVAFGILRAFAKREIEFAYPTQTTFTAAPDGKMIMPYPPGAIVPVRDAGAE